MTDDLSTQLLHRIAARACARPEFLGWLLVRYLEIEKVSEEQLVELLEMRGDDLPRLKLCLRPDADRFLADVTQIAGKFRLSLAKLAGVIRRVEAVEAMSGAAAAAGTPLLAARARKKKPGTRSKKQDGTKRRRTKED
jgi:hypothetical protein